jgi:hypothetical protein
MAGTTIRCQRRDNSRSCPNRSQVVLHGNRSARHICKQRNEKKQKLSDIGKPRIGRERCDDSNQNCCEYCIANDPLWQASEAKQ